jgi:hypothetical protein
LYADLTVGEGLALDVYLEAKLTSKEAAMRISKIENKPLTDFHAFEK